VKRTPLFVLSILVIASFVLTACGGGKAATKVTVATDATFPPFEMVDSSTKELTGFDIDLMKAVADKAGFEIEFANTPFDSVTAGVSNCQYDIAIAAITITDERKQQMLFSDPYINAGQIVVVRKDNTDIKGYADLKGKTVAAQLGTTGEIEAKKIENVTYKPYDTYDLAFLDLQNGQVDAVIADYPTALGFIGKNPDKLMVTGEVFTDESYGIAVCKSKSDLVEKINAALKTLKDDGKIKELEDKYLAAQ
jgi:polar amino acid transport system substrate-binding protein